MKNCLPVKTKVYVDLPSTSTATITVHPEETSQIPNIFKKTGTKDGKTSLQCLHLRKVDNKSDRNH